MEKMKNMKKYEFHIFYRIFNNALRGHPRGNKVDGLPRGSSLRLAQPAKFAS